MSTLTHSRAVKQIGGHERMTLAVTGTKGTFAFEQFRSPTVILCESVRRHSTVELPGDAECPTHDGCWVDAYRPTRVSWALVHGGEEAALAELEALYRTELDAS